MKNIKIGVKLPSSKEINAQLDKLLKKGYDINLNSDNFKNVINEITNNTEKLKTELNGIGKGSFDNVTKSAEKSMAVFTELAETMGKLNEKSQARVKNNSNTAELKQAQAINQALDEQYRKQQSLNNLKEQLSNKISIASKNGFVDTTVIDNLQNKLNSINSNSAEKEINELKTAINNLSSSDSGIVRLQSAITRLQERISNIKKNKIDIIDTSEISELKLAETEVANLKNMLTQLKTGDVIDGKKISSSINSATSSVRTLENEFRNVNTTASGLSTTMKSIFSYAIGGSGIYLVMNSMRDAFNTTLELDTAMRDLRRVTEETESVYAEFMKTANETAVALGTTTSGAIEATTTFSQLGYTFEQASEYMSQMALILSNVGDMSASDAASSLVSILKGFRLEAEETTKVVDILNEAGNRFALTTADLTEGLRVGGASLATANNDLNQASALIIAGTEVMRDSNTVAQGLKTISLRMRGVSEDGEELNASMGEFIKTMTGVDLTDANGEFRSTYDVLKEIGEVWDTLNSMEQASLAEEIAGKNRVIIAPCVQKCA